MKVNTMKLHKKLITLALIALLLAATLPFGGSQARAAAEPKELRIGYQRNGVWPLLKAKGVLEKKFPNTKVSWAVFPAGPQLLEALNAGAIDIGSTGDTPPIFAQAAGTPLVYVAQVAGSGSGSAVLVPENSPLKTVADLKGKKVAFQKASSSHLLIVRALEKFGLTYKDIQPTFLPPSEARAAFQSGSIDAWVIWDPFRASAIKELNARALIEGQDVSRLRSFVEGSKTFVADYPDTVRALIEEVKVWQAWIYDNQDEYAEILAKETGLAVEVIKFTLSSERQEYFWLDEAGIEYQQKVADTFFALGLIPEKLNIRDVVWIGGTNPAPATAAATAAATVAATAVATATK
jgi:sulfonate transport system substrate-binding protein